MAEEFQQQNFLQPLALRINNLTKIYDGMPAVSNFNIEIPRGRIVGLLGPNGSGKTTLLKMIAGVLCPTSGAIYVDGIPVSEKTKSLVSFLPERPYFSSSMKVSDTLSYFADFYADFDYALAVTMLARLGVPQDAQMKLLSKGTKEKVQLILVMSRRAHLYLLDEPIGGVDPATRDFILNTVLSNYRRDASILVSTHLVADIEHVIDDFIFIQKGTCILHAPAAYAHTNYGKSLDELFREAFRC